MFEGDDFHNWKFRMRMYLISKRWWNAVESSDSKATNEDPSTLTDASTKRTGLNEDADKQALAAIVLSLGNQQLNIVRHATTARQAWLSLQEHYERKGIANQLALKRLLHKLKMEEGDEMKGHIDRIETTVSKLAAAGHEIPEDEKVMILLTSLPEAYDNFVMALESKDSKITWDFLVGRLYDEEFKRNELTHIPKSVKSYAFIGQNKDPRTCYNCGVLGHISKHCRKPKGNHEITCNVCYKKGHLGKDCRWRKESGSPNNSKRQSKRPLPRKSTPNNPTSSYYALTATLMAKANVNDWVIDSGASDHMTNERHLLTDFVNINEKPITVAEGGRTISAIGKGTATINIEKVKGNEIILVKDVLYVPELATNLLSVPRMEAKGSSVLFSNGNAKILDSFGTVKAVADKKNGLYILNTTSKSYHTQVNTAQDDSMLWHERYGHLNFNYLKQLQIKNMVDGMSNVDGKDDKYCEVCIKGKMTKVMKTNKPRTPKDALEVVHTDVCGPMQVKTLFGEKYFVTFIDEYSHLVVTYLLKSKDEVLNKLITFTNMAETQSGKKIKFIQCDNGGEYINNQMERWCNNKGVIMRKTIPYHPEQNGIAERMNRTIMEKARCMLSSSNLPMNLWGEAVMAATYIINRSPTSALPKSKTPIEMWTRRKPDVSHMRKFGSISYAHIPNEIRRKLDDKARLGIMVGYELNGYRLYDLVTKRIFRAKNVKFNENETVSSYPSVRDPTSPQKDKYITSFETEKDTIEEVKPEEEMHIDDSSTPDDDDKREPEEVESEEDDNNTFLRRSTRQRSKPSTWWIAKPFAGIAQVNESQCKRIYISDGEHDEYDWKLNRRDANEIFSIFGLPDVDLFASNINRQVKNYCGPKPLGENVITERLATNAFDLIWDGSHGSYYANSPFDEGCMMEILDKVERDETPSLIMIIPSMFPKVISKAYTLSIEEPIELKHHKDLFIPEDKQLEKHEKGVGKPKWKRTYAFKISGQINPIALITSLDIPKTYEDAMKSSDALLWKTAMDEEINSLMKNNTWILTDLPKGKKLVGSRWVYTYKYNENGTINKYKARLVAQGFSQKYGIDYNETYAPVSKLTTIRTILAIAASEDLELWQYDVKTAFLNGSLEEDIYLQQPKGYEDGTSKVCKLKKGIYGLKQSPRNWYSTLNNSIISNGFTRLKTDLCLYVKRENSQIAFVLVFVDDIIIGGNNIVWMNSIKDNLFSRFDMKDMGDLSYFLGWKITRNRKEKTISINQTTYIRDIIKRYGMNHAKPIWTPEDTTWKYSYDNESNIAEKKTPYREAIGSLMFAMTGTRVDIAHAVGVLSRYQDKHHQSHWTGVKRVLRYLNATDGIGITYGKSTEKVTLTGYADADWAGDLQDRKSTSGYVFMLAGGAISWCSKKQPVVALSTTESEYISASAAATEAIWIRTLLMELGYCQDRPTTIYEDNQSCITISNNPEKHNRTKHIDIRYHYLRQLIEENKIKLEYIDTENQIADLLTKPLPRPKFDKLRKLLGMELVTNI
jgi:hypothetical protein